MSYYKRFEILSHSLFWRAYLRWSYATCINDLEKLNSSPSFQKDNFTCLLCGVSGDITAEEFITFTLNKNSNAKIIIIDYADEQIKAISKLVKKKYAKASIIVKKANALNLEFIPTQTIDWIETDGLLEYFNKKDLKKLLNEWKRILRKNGFITLREFAGSGFSGFLADKFRVWIGKVYLQVIFYRHTRAQLENVFNENKLTFITGISPFPTYRRYTLIKSE